MPPTTATYSQIDADRVHFAHGPIDLIIQASGNAAAIATAHQAAWQRFQTILAELVLELAALRRPITPETPILQSPIARRMAAACLPYAAAQFITPMAAVAGAVAEELLPFYTHPAIAKILINNGGDIAIGFNQPDQTARIGIYSDLAKLDAAQIRGELKLDGTITITAASPIRGIATSGWRGRSFSLGIADSVTVLAATAAAADAAATMIANAVNCDHAAIIRAPANQVKDDSDLGDRLVTREVPPLPNHIVQQAIEAGLAKGYEYQQRGLIHQAYIFCQSQFGSLP
ncbi:MAG: UPF0280 family protein [Candidatus Symbiobacter sp.]|nr:UPF0280 family protein [Candidatus Symbiobacter sp.]